MASCVLGGSDGDGRRVPEKVTGAEFVLQCDTVISAIGQSADLAGSEGLRRTAGGTIEVDDEGFTGTSGVYAGGDATLGSASVIEAIACGRRAAHALDRELSGGAPTIAPLESTRRVDVEGVLTRKGSDGRAWRVPLALVSPGRRRKTFTPYRRVLTEAEAKAEASRCYRCGCGVGCQLCHDACKMFAWDIEGTRVQVREKDCVACGMCAWRCPNGNIEMVQTGSEPI
jgi:NAD-dependent dihydropyrimidine dehydrogenase PreA subunit